VTNNYVIGVKEREDIPSYIVDDHAGLEFCRLSKCKGSTVIGNTVSGVSYVAMWAPFVQCPTTDNDFNSTPETYFPFRHNVIHSCTMHGLVMAPNVDRSSFTGSNIEKRCNVGAYFTAWKVDGPPIVTYFKNSNVGFYKVRMFDNSRGVSINM
jgi:hypothetical protein